VKERRALGAMAGAWLRGAVRENLAFKLLSLVLSLGMWAFIQGEQVVEESAWAEVAYLLPEGLVMAETPARRVRVTLTGAQAFVKEIRRRALHVTVDLREVGAGVQNVDFVESQIEGLPQNVKVVGLVPNSIQVELEKRVTRKVQVDAAIVGEAAEGYRISAVRLVPTQVEVVGPASLVRGLQRVTTDGIDVAGLSRTTRLPVTLSLRNEALSLSPGQAVEAEIVVEQVTSTRVFEAVPVVVRAKDWRAVTESVEVALVGPSSVLEKIRPDAITVLAVIPEDAVRKRIELTGNASRAARYEVVHPGGEEVEVGSLTPARVLVEPVD
jgi:hypothetical protein